MKYIKIVGFLVIFLMSKDVMARTAGAYYGINLIRYNNEAGNYNDSEGNSLNNSVAKDISTEDQISVGLNYKVAFNVLGLYVAPGVFYDFANVSEYDNSGQEWELNSRFGLRVDGGYDLTDKLAGYAFTGYASTNLSVNNSAGGSSENEIDPFYGLGVKYSVLGNIDVNFEYEFSGYKIGTVTGDVQAEQEFDSQVMRLGINFRY